MICSRRASWRRGSTVRAMSRSCRATNLDSTIPLPDGQAGLPQVCLCFGARFGVLAGRAPSTHQAVLVAAELGPAVLPAPVVGLERVGGQVTVAVLLERSPQPVGADAVCVQAGQHSSVTVQHDGVAKSEEHTSELQSRGHLVCRLLLEKKKQTSA